MTDQQREEIKARRAAITPGMLIGFSCEGELLAIMVAGGKDFCLAPEESERHPENTANMEFIKHAPDDIDALLRENAELRAALRKDAETP